jgi:3-hydroxybutyryl-CoA dehydrogenase
MDVRRIMIVGSGVMGRGIAQSAAFSGFDVTLHDVSQELLDNATSAVKGNIERYFVAKGKISREQGDEIASRIRTSAILEEAAKGADFVIEAVPEDILLKKSIFSRLDAICDVDTILASNTSALPVTAIASATGRPQKCVGTHFFNPATVMKLVEVVLPLGISEETVATTIAVCEKMGKVPVKVKDVPGFIVNRLLTGFYMEAAQIVLEGTATPDEIDIAMRLGVGHPIGPCELADMGGFDVIQMSSDALFEYTHSDKFKCNLLYRKMLEAGRLGKKNGKGFYDYHPDGTKTPAKLF